MKYSNYLQTLHWKKTRQLKLENNPCCGICLSSKFLHIHHRHYKKNNHNILFREELNSLFTLCSKCHKTWHNIHGLEEYTYKSMRNAGRFYQMGLSRKDAIKLCVNEDLYRFAFRVYIKNKKLGYISKKDILTIKKLQNGNKDNTH